MSLKSLSALASAFVVPFTVATLALNYHPSYANQTTNPDINRVLSAKTLECADYSSNPLVAKAYDESTNPKRTKTHLEHASSIYDIVFDGIFGDETKDLDHTTIIEQILNDGISKRSYNDGKLLGFMTSDNAYLLKLTIDGFESDKSQNKLTYKQLQQNFQTSVNKSQKSRSNNLADKSTCTSIDDLMKTHPLDATTIFNYQLNPCEGVGILDKNTKDTKTSLTNQNFQDKQLLTTTLNITIYDLDKDDKSQTKGQFDLEFTFEEYQSSEPQVTMTEFFVTDKDKTRKEAKYISSSTAVTLKMLQDLSDYCNQNPEVDTVESYFDN